MHARFKLRRYQVLAARSQILADAAQRMVDELLHLADTQQSAELATLTGSYCMAIDEVRAGIRAGANLPPLLFKLEAIGREVASSLLALQQTVIRRTRDDLHRAEIRQSTSF